MDEARSVEIDRTRIYWIGGSKGGVGKSMMTIAILDYLIANGQSVVLVECDTSNPDVWKAYQELLPTELINLDEGDGWIQLVNVCDRHRDHGHSECLRERTGGRRPARPSTAPGNDSNWCRARRAVVSH